MVEAPGSDAPRVRRRCGGSGVRCRNVATFGDGVVAVNWPTERDGPDVEPVVHAAREACRKFLAGEELTDYDRDALRQVVFVEDMEALPNEF